MAAIINFKVYMRKWDIDLGEGMVPSQWRNSPFKSILLVTYCYAINYPQTGPDGWMASLTQWTWVWVDSRNW